MTKIKITVSVANLESAIREALEAESQVYYEDSIYEVESVDLVKEDGVEFTFVANLQRVEGKFVSADNLAEEYVGMIDSDLILPMDITQA